MGPASRAGRRAGEPQRDLALGAESAGHELKLKDLLIVDIRDRHHSLFTFGPCA
jgi:hypothetical protein